MLKTLNTTRSLSSRVAFARNVPKTISEDMMLSLPCLRNATSFKRISEMPEFVDRNAPNSGYITFKSAEDKLRALINCSEKHNQMSIGRDNQIYNEGKMYAIELLPHDTHEILNVSGVVDSGLTVDDFRNSGFENVEEVYQFPKYDMAGNVVDKITKSNAYGRF